MDIVDKSTRSRMMAGIRSKNTKPEMAVRRFLHRCGFRYVLHSKKLPGRPDITLPKYRVTIFVHGCFWHQHPGCKYAYTPSSNQEKWKKKFIENADRDERHIKAVLDLGWKVIIIWECGLRKRDIALQLDWLVEAITSPTQCMVEWPSYCQVNTKITENQNSLP
jgi:DNA mismatch endonuclease (patch repair protein)